MWLGLTAPQLESVALMIGGAVWLFLPSRNGGVRLSGPTPVVATA